MVSIIKNQLLKHLSRYTKNLSADKINLSTFKGEGELSNLELDEDVLTDLLELPSWLRLTEAWCNKVAFKIPWRKLKTVPMQLNLDEVNITVETCEELRPLSSQITLAAELALGEYGFIHKVIDGITVTVNTVNVLFNSRAFTASVQISRITVESRTAKWSNCSDLRFTRLKDTTKGQILLFKELKWQTVRIEAKSTVDKNLTPLRLLTNQARCRIVIKKRLKDCFIMGSKLVMILDDLLWVLTDSQLKAALHFVDSLAGLVRKATLIAHKVKAARKLEEFPEYQIMMARTNSTTSNSTPNDPNPTSNNPSSRTRNQIFDMYDVIETSYHFVSNEIVLHLCDDTGEGRSCHPHLNDGGAFHMTLKRFQIDFYPYHLARADRRHWPRYREAAVPHAMWQEQALAAFKSKFINLVDRNERLMKMPLKRQMGANSGQGDDGVGGPGEGKKTNVSNNNNVNNNNGSASSNGKELRRQIECRLSKLMTACFIIRIEDFVLYKVTTSGRKQDLKEFITGDRDYTPLPKDASILHAEFIYYYYPSDSPFPLPPPKFYVQLNPVQVVFDVDTCIWLNAFLMNLYQSLNAAKTDLSQTNYTYIDVKIEAILLRLTFEAATYHPNQRDRPTSLTFEVTRVNVTNVRSLEHSSRADLAKCVDSFQMGSLFFSSDFPAQTNDYSVVTQKFLDHISAEDNIRNVPLETDALLEQLNRESFWMEAKDVWCISLDPVSGDFWGAPAIGTNRAVPFLYAVPITLWLHTKLDPNSTVKCNDSGDGTSNADVHALAYISNLVSVQLNHYQYLFLLRLSEELSELMTFISVDTKRILQEEKTGTIVVGALLPQIEVTFVMPSVVPGKETSGGDVESILPDTTSSLADEGVLGGSTGTMWRQTNTSSTNNSLAMTATTTAQDPLTSTTPVTTKVTNGTLISTSVRNSTHTAKLVTSHSMEFQRTTAFSPISTDRNNTPTLKSPKNTMTSYASKPNNLNASLMSMKKGFSNFMSSLDGALKSGTAMDDASDTLSTRSEGGSSDSDTILSNMEADAALLDQMFSVRDFTDDTNSAPPIEMASEVVEDEEESISTTMSDHSITGTCSKRKDLICISTFKLTKVEFIQQSIGYESAIKIHVGNIACLDCTSIPWDEFQTKFVSRSRVWSSSPTGNTAPKIKLRLDHTLVLPNEYESITGHNTVKREDLSALYRSFVTINVNDLDLKLAISAVIGLGDLVEDEVVPIPLPLELSVGNVHLELNDDRPPVNITSPGAVPIHLNVTEMHIKRTPDGVFHFIHPIGSSTVPTTTDQYLVAPSNANEDVHKQYSQLLSEVEELRRRLVPFERVMDENHQLRKANEENIMLKTWLATAQDENARLLDEKRRLLDEIHQLRTGSNSSAQQQHQQWSIKR